MDCKVYAAPVDEWLRVGRGGGASGGRVGGLRQMADGFSHESENDLAAMVRDFVENGSAGTDSGWSTDSDSSFCELAHLSDKISVSIFLCVVFLYGFLFLQFFGAAVIL